MKTRRIRPCQFCGKGSPKTPKHDGKFICTGHQALKRKWLEERETEEIADAYRARVAARQAKEQAVEAIA